MKHTNNAASAMRIVTRPWGFGSLNPEFIVDGVLVCTIDTESWTVIMHVDRDFTEAERDYLIAWREEREAAPRAEARAPKPTAAAGTRLHLVPQGMSPYAFAATLAPQRETAPASVTLPRPSVQTSSSSNHDQYTPAEPGGEYVFTCRSCGSPDLASLWGAGFLDEPTRCNACGAKTYEDPDCTLHFPEFCPDFAAIAPYTGEPAAAEVAA